MIGYLQAVAGVSSHAAFVRACGRESEYNLASPYDMESAPAFSSGPPVKNAGRFPPHVRAAFIAAALVIEASGRTYPDGESGETAILTAGYDPTLQVNLDFFKDYLDAGRTMGRGNLFIYTLPTGAACEVSIHFGLKGPALFIEPETAPLAGALDAAESALEGGEITQVLLLWQDCADTFCIAAGPRLPGAKPLCSIADLRRRASVWQRPLEAVRHFKPVAP